MNILYSISISIYTSLILLFSFFNKKAKLWIHGRKNLFNRLSKIDTHKKNVIWIHAASLGEFEQAIPLIENFKKHKKNFILVTFFSPSGFEIRKNYPLADFICYLPADTKTNSKKFISIIKPDMAIFIKYEFWFNYLKELKNKKIKTYLVSGIFRPNQHFFQFYGYWFQKQLSAFNYFFVQNLQSQELLASVGYTNVELTGDTRFDRVNRITKSVYKNDLIESFCIDKKVIIAGSTWNAEHEFIKKYVQETPSEISFIIAPHEIDDKKIQLLKNEFKSSCILFSETDNLSDISNYKILIIDQIGMLSKLYRFAYISIVGGGFGSGIHNILEAATYGSPILFGPNYQKFQEAIDLINIGAAKSFKNFQEFKIQVDNLILNPNQQKAASSKALKFVESNLGSTELILKKIANN